MATRAQLNAQPRELLGKKVRRLRRAGILPATVYGHNVEPRSIQLDAHETAGVLRRAGTTQLIDLIIEGEPARPVLIRQTTFDAKRNAVTHIEFFQANLREKLVTHLPLHFTGESPAVKEGGIMLHLLDRIDVESLPQDVPAGGIEVDTSQIEEMNGQILAGDLPLPPGLALITSPEEVVCRVTPPITEEAVEEALAEPEAPLPGEPEAQEAEQQQPEAVPEA